MKLLDVCENILLLIYLLLMYYIDSGKVYVFNNLD